MSPNPYSWKVEDPQHQIRRPELDTVLRLLQRGEAVMVSAGRGMGKSVLRQQVEKELVRDNLRILSIGLPGPGATVLSELIRAELDLKGPHFERALRNRLEGSDQDLVILIDELDAWVHPERREDTRNTLNALHSLRSRQALSGRLAVLTLGGISHLLLQHSPWGSPFSSRAVSVELRPLGMEQQQELIRPVQGRVSAEWSCELALASGGIPLLMCRVLEEVWTAKETPRPADLLSAFVGGEGRGFRDAVLNGIGEKEMPDAKNLLNLISRSQGELRCAEVEEVLKAGVYRDTALRVLLSSGLVHPDADSSMDPWRVRLNPSALLLGQLGIEAREGSSNEGPLDRLNRAFDMLCAQLHIHSSDLFRGAGDGRGLVPEDTFCAFTSMILQALGYRVARERQQGPGRVDLWVDGGDLSGHVIVEVKIWGRNNYQKIEQQLLSYALPPSPASAGTCALVALMICEGTIDQQRYESCVQPTGALVTPNTWRGQVQVQGQQLPLSHLLVCLPRR